MERPRRDLISRRTPVTAADTLELRHENDVDKVRQLLVDIHVEVRGDFGLMDRPFNSAKRFDERLSSYASRPGWETVIGYDGGEAVGYAFAVPLAPDSRWWSSMLTPLPDEYTTETGARTLALNEILVRQQWRGTDTARRIHDELLSERTEERVTLLVNPEAGNGKVKAVYESWGYEQIGDQQPFPDSPRFAVMMRDLHAA